MTVWLCRCGHRDGRHVGTRRRCRAKDCSCLAVEKTVLLADGELCRCGHASGHHQDFRGADRAGKCEVVSEGLRQGGRSGRVKCQCRFWKPPLAPGSGGSE